MPTVVSLTSGSGHEAFADLADLPEDERIEAIGQAVMAGNVVGVVVDAEPAKVARYINKICARLPAAYIQHTGPGPVPRTMTIRVALREEAKS